METVDDIQALQDMWDPEFTAHPLKGHTPWFDSLIEKKRNQGRYHFHPVPSLAALRKMPGTSPEYGRWIIQVHDLEHATSSVSSKDTEMPGSATIPLAGIKPHENVQRLEQRIRFLEAQLESQRPYLQLYRIGATGLFLAFISLAAWALAGIAIPLHPVFAMGSIPVALGVMIMAFLIRPTSK